MNIPRIALCYVYEKLYKLKMISESEYWGMDIKDIYNSMYHTVNKSYELAKHFGDDYKIRNLKPLVQVLDGEWEEICRDYKPHMLSNNNYIADEHIRIGIMKKSKQYYAELDELIKSGKI